MAGAAQPITLGVRSAASQLCINNRSDDLHSLCGAENNLHLLLMRHYKSTCDDVSTVGRTSFLCFFFFFFRNFEPFEMKCVNFQ